MSDVMTDRRLLISDSAADRIATLVKMEGDKPGTMLRLTVSGGGCSGFQYGFNFDEAVNADDHVFEHKGTKVVTDDCSLDLLAGATLDYVEDLMGSAFQVKNPNAKSSCGCGTSFAV